MASSEPAGRSLRIAILHPELILGGAERLIVDIARALQSGGHEVEIFTTRHEPTQSLADAEISSIRVLAPPFPPHICQRLRAACAITRMAWLARKVLAERRFDVIVCDQVPQIVPLLKKLAAAPVIFYCHYPDQLLPVRSPFGFYRRPIHRLEERGMQLADLVLVNSLFTREAVRRTFPNVMDDRIRLLYPAVEVRSDNPIDVSVKQPSPLITILSFNRFKPEKRHELAIDAFGALRQLLPGPTFDTVRLTIAGGFDSSLDEDRQTLTTLRGLATNHRLEEQILFIPSPSEGERLRLLRNCSLSLYTPDGEHFGFGPLEAMAASKPVIAVASGGPTETVVHQVTGLLCAPEPNEFASAMARLILDPVDAIQMGQAGRRRVEQHFSLTTFAITLQNLVREASERQLSKD